MVLHFEGIGWSCNRGGPLLPAVFGQGLCSYLGQKCFYFFFCLYFGKEKHRSMYFGSVCSTLVCVQSKYCTLQCN